MVELKNYEFIIDGQPRLIIAGEVHYFRLPMERWDATLDQAIEAGCNTIATYLPWHYHEEVEGYIDWVGERHQQLNLKLFLEKIRARGLMIFLRPGPFIMAEMKNEGLPYWLMKKYPHIIPTTWDHQVVSTATVDYSHPDFLSEVKKYYHSLMPIIRPFLHQNGGPIIAIQLDNEIGMLSWVSNSPDLTPTTLHLFKAYLHTTYRELVHDRYPYIDTEEFTRRIISPQVDAAQIHFDLGNFMRHRFRNYADQLKTFFDEEGVTSVPYVINVHGTSDGRALLFPIGLSQLKDTFDAPHYLAGSDLYLGDFTMNNFHDYYIVNGMQQSLNHYHQPLATVEFNCGDGNFGDDLGMRMDPASTDLKARLCFAQGHKVINYYLLSGGENALLDEQPNDGNNRIAITGQRHGFAAPIGPEGQYNITFKRLAEVNHSLLSHEKLLANSHPIFDRIAMGWIPDYFMTESAYPRSEHVRTIYQNIRNHREGQVWNSVMKLLLLRTISAQIIDLQSQQLSASSCPILIIESARYMSELIQSRLVEYVRTGGSLWLFGELPEFDMEGNRLTILIDALQVSPQPSVFDQHRLYLSVTPEGPLQHRPEYRIYTAQPWTCLHSLPLLSITHTHEQVAGIIHHHMGKVMLWCAPVPGHLELLDHWLQLFTYQSNFKIDDPQHGVVLIANEGPQGQLIHLINIDNVDKKFHILHHDRVMLGGHQIQLPAKRGLILPVDLKLPVFVINYSTMELQTYDKQSLVFRAYPGEHAISIEGNVRLTSSKTPKSIRQNSHRVEIEYHFNSEDSELVIRLEEKIDGE